MYVVVKPMLQIASTHPGMQARPDILPTKSILNFANEANDLILSSFFVGWKCSFIQMNELQNIGLKKLTLFSPRELLQKKYLSQYFNLFQQ